jgi:hypothetical protein
MPVQVSYPGVYIEELPSGVRTIVGVSTSVAAMVGYLRRGPLNTPVQIFNFGDFQRVFGGLDGASELSYGVSQFFLNGGAIAWISRVASQSGTSPLATASITVASGVGGSSAPVLTIAASSAGTWGNSIQVTIDNDTSDPSTLFNITANAYTSSAGGLMAANTTTARNVTMDLTQPNNAPAVVANIADSIISLTSLNAAGTTTPPAPTGAVGTAALTDTIAQNLTNAQLTVAVALVAGQSGQSYIFTLPSIPNLAALAPIMQGVMQPQLPSAQVKLLASNVVSVALSDPLMAGAILTFSGGAAQPLGLTTSNVQAYTLNATAAAGAQSAATPGGDGLPPTAADLIGSPMARSGLSALDTVDLFNLLCLPDLAKMTASDGASVIAAAGAYCEQRRAFLIADVPQTVATLQAAQAWISQLGSSASTNAAAYFPQPMIPDPLAQNRLAARAASGTLAGLYAATDADRGVWKSPAGVDAALRGVMQLTYQMTDAENGTLNQLGLNCLRTLPIYGNVCWGARTLYGADQRASEWKYIAVRRIALFIEESLYRGLQWVVFEPNDEPLWSQIRLNVSAFLQDMFVKGAFAGQTPKQAYFVNCNSSTTSQADIDRGIVNIVVGFAPLKPAEFVILSLQQIAGQTAT